MNNNVVGVIPARFASTRLPGKPLIEISGKPLIQWVYEAACRCATLDEILIATDDDRIMHACKKFGATTVMTSDECPTGSDRIAEAVQGKSYEIIVNIQGDEPLLDPTIVDECVRALQTDSAAGVCSAMTPFVEGEDYTDPNMVKVVTDNAGYAMYFSRAPIPDIRRLTKNEKAGGKFSPMKHVGLYIYRRSVLEDYVKMTPSIYEQCEKLEQLRLLEAGIKIRMIPIEHAAVGVDTPEDVVRVEKLLGQ